MLGFGSQAVAMRENGALYFLHGDDPATALRASLAAVPSPSTLSATSSHPLPTTPLTHHASAGAHAPPRWISSASEQTTQFVYDGDGTLTTLYYPAAGAVRVIEGGNDNLYYVLKDHLGSASVTLDASGNVVANGEQRYYPFGESRITGASLPTDRLFTGQRDVGLGFCFSSPAATTSRGSAIRRSVPLSGRSLDQI